MGGQGNGDVLKRLSKKRSISSIYFFSTGRTEPEVVVNTPAAPWACFRVKNISRTIRFTGHTPAASATEERLPLFYSQEGNKKY